MFDALGAKPGIDRNLLKRMRDRPTAAEKLRVVDHYSWFKAVAESACPGQRISIRGYLKHFAPHVNHSSLLRWTQAAEKLRDEQIRLQNQVTSEKSHRGHGQKRNWCAK